jgi:hypothetical protein
MTKKQYLLIFFVDICGYKTFVKIYLMPTEILSAINSRVGSRDISGEI